MLGMVKLARWTSAAGLLSMVLSCGGDPEATADEGNLTSKKSIIGRWVSDDDTYASDIRFRDDGTFIGDLNRPMIGASPCAADEENCTNIVLGEWRVTKGHKLVLEVPRVVEVTEGTTVTLRYEVSSSPK